MYGIIADDDPDARALAIRALLQELPGLIIREVTDRATLDQALNEISPEILITDYDLHWCKGFEVFSIVKTKYPNCCTIMFTGTGSEEVAVEAMKLGFDDYLVKAPRKFKRLAAKTRIAFERAQEHLELQENRNLLLKELYHRLHNNLQIVIGLITLTARSLPDDTSQIQIFDLGRRIQSLSILQEEFYRTRDLKRINFRTYFLNIFNNLIESNIGRVKLSDMMDDTEIPVDVAVPLGLMANEIAMAFVKQAAGIGQESTLTVRLYRDKETVMLSVTGPGTDVPRDMMTSPPGLGLQLVDRLASQIGADVSLIAGQTETECRITVPL